MYLKLDLSKIGIYNMLNYFLQIHISMLPQMDDLILELLMDLIFLHVSTTWIRELKLSSFAITHPQVTFSAFTNGLVSIWLFTAHTNLMLMIF